MTANAVVWIGAASPLFQYSPTRNGPIDTSWIQDPSGTICAGSQAFAVDIQGLYFSEITFEWKTSGSFLVSVGVGLDGTLQQGQSSTGVTLSAPMGIHDIRLETVCAGCTNSQTFTLTGVRIVTNLDGVNATLDDSALEIAYKGFRTENAHTSNIAAIAAGSFFGDTVSYTSSAGSTASFSFTGSALYVFAPTGPAFGTFSLSLDGQDKGRYNASTTLDTYDTLLYFVSGLTDATHSVVMTNMDQGMLLALDYIVAVSGTGLTTPGQVGPVPPNAIATVVAGTTTLLNPAATNVGVTPTAVFPGQTTGTDRGNNGAAGLAIGLTLGILAAIFLLWLAWRWRQWKKAGGEGGFLLALCGARHRPPKAAPPKDQKFHLWPMVRSRPKYATGD